MRRSTTSAATERPLLGLFLLVELIIAGAVLAGPLHHHSAQNTPAVPAAANAALEAPAPGPEPSTLADGRTVSMIALGGTKTAGLAGRVMGELDGAADAVTAFWGDAWPRTIVVVLTGTDEQFRTLVGQPSDIAAATTPGRIVFAPGAVEMSDAALRIVLRHELLHYAARARTASDAPRWLTEGVADYLGRPPTAKPGPAGAAELARLPTDADLDTPGRVRSLAYDRAWWFSRYVASRYGADTLRALYQMACSPGHPDAATALQSTLGAPPAAVVAGWRAWLSG